MYHDYLGREVEDLEMDNMRDAQKVYLYELQQEKPLEVGTWVYVDATFLGVVEKVEMVSNCYVYVGDDLGQDIVVPIHHVRMGKDAIEQGYEDIETLRVNRLSLVLTPLYKRGTWVNDLRRSKTLEERKQAVSDVAIFFDYMSGLGYCSYCKRYTCYTECLKK